MGARAVISILEGKMLNESINRTAGLEGHRVDYAEHRATVGAKPEVRGNREHPAMEEMSSRCRSSLIKSAKQSQTHHDLHARRMTELCSFESPVAV